MKLSIVFLLIFFFLQTTGQKIILYSIKESAVWPLENDYHFYVPGEKCSSFIIKSSNGKINQKGCRFSFYPDTSVDTKFTVYRKINHKLVFFDSILIKVYERHLTELRLGVKIGGNISKEEIIATGGLLASAFITEDQGVPLILKSFYVVSISAGSGVRFTQNIGYQFTPETILLLRGLMVGNKLIFANIVADDWKGRTYEVKPAEFTINKAD